MTDPYAIHTDGLRERRRQHIVNYVARSGVAPRDFNRRWALFYGSLIRKLERMRHERA